MSISAFFFLLLLFALKNISFLFFFFGSRDVGAKKKVEAAEQKRSASERCVCSKHETLPIKSQNRAVRNVGKQNSAGSGPLLEPINQSAMRGWDLNWLDN